MGKRVVIVGVNDLGTTHPHLVDGWSKRNVDSIEEYTYGSNKKKWWTCELGHEYSARICHRTRKNSSGCRYCSGQDVWPGFNDLATTNPSRAAEVSPRSPIKATEISQGSDKKILWRCSDNPNHPDYWATIYNRERAGCHSCMLEANKVAPFTGISVAEEFPHLIPLWDDDNEVSIYEVSRGSDYRAKVTYECGHKNQTMVHNLIRSGCPRCTDRVSTPETELAEFIRGIVPLGILVETSQRGIIPRRELDIYIHSLSIAIEFNGLYWHSERFLDKNYHHNKWKLCHDKGIQLITIWEDEWTFKRPIVERMLTHKLGVSKDTKIGARKTKVVQLDHKEASKFLNQYHIQGKASGSHYIGLEYDEELVAASVFSKSGDGLRLDRYASSCTVQGGMSKIMKHMSQFSSHFETFADLCVSDGSLYESTGWTKTKELPPDYKYVRQMERLHKFNFRKNRFRDRDDLLYDPTMTEQELASLNKLTRIWDCGKIKYEMDLS